MNPILSEGVENYLLSSLPAQSSLLAEMEVFALQNKIPILHRHTARFVELLAPRKKNARVLELGTAIGYTAIRLAHAMQGNGTVFTIEKSAPNINLAKGYIERSGCSAHIRLLEGEAVNVLPTFDKKFDMIFLDADKEDYIELFTQSLPLLKKNGIYLVDNLLWHGLITNESSTASNDRSVQHIHSFNAIFLHTPQLQSTILPIGDGLGFGIKNSKKEFNPLKNFPI